MTAQHVESGWFFESKSNTPRDVETFLTEPTPDPHPRSQRNVLSVPVRVPPLQHSPRSYRSHRKAPQLPPPAPLLKEDTLDEFLRESKAQTTVSKLLMSVPSERRRRAADWHRRQHSATRLQSAQRGRMVRRALTMSMMTPQMGPRIVLPEWRADERNPVSAIPSAPLREVAPTWMRPLPPRVVKAADRFDARHSRRAKASSRLYVALVRDVTSGDKSRHFEKEIIELRRNRYWAEPAPPKPKVTDTYVRSPRSGAYSYAGGKRPSTAPGSGGSGSGAARAPPAPPVWSLETSIWWPRVAWCDSKSLYDTEECERKKLTTIFNRARDIGMQRFIIQNDDDDDDGEVDDEDGDGIPDEVQQVEEVLWEQHDLLFMMFDLYSGLGDDLTSLEFNQYLKLVKDYHLADPKSKAAKPSDLDRCFIAVGAASKKWNAQGKDKHLMRNKSDHHILHERDKCLSLAEFVHILVRIAVRRYVMEGKEKDVSDAMRTMMKADVLPDASAAVLADNNDFRRKHCYIEPVDQVLKKYEASLRNIFEGIADTPSSKIGALVTYKTWLALITKLELLNDDVSEREVSLAFICSRMCIANPFSARGHYTTTGLPFEGFLEALVRTACLKALPTDEEITAAGFTDAAAYMRWYCVEDEDGYMEMLATRGVQWGDDPPQPTDRCVEHVMSIIIRHIESATTMDKDSNLALSAKEVRKWWSG